MAQLVRAPPCHGGGHEFESRLGRFGLNIDRYFAWGLSSAGRASALQAEGHRFEPCRPHSNFINAPVAELADAWDLKSHGGDTVPVQVRSGADNRRS